jgi:transposase InsO family protein
LCGLFGKSRQAYYQRSKYNYKEVIKEDLLLHQIEKQRRLMPRIGGRKLLKLLADHLPKEYLPGRDRLFDFMREHHLLINKRRRRVRTTYSNHWLHKYPNLIKDVVPIRANELWVSDITYIETSEGFIFLNLITDAYSRKIIGWSVGDTLAAIYTEQALDKALAQLPRRHSELIHHSDRGVQYCSRGYVKKLEKHKILISMTENGDPRENAIAERVNGILKEEWLNHMQLQTIEQAKAEIKRIIMIYNSCRPHASLNLFTPEQAHRQSGAFKQRWKNYYRTTKMTKEAR